MDDDRTHAEPSQETIRRLAHSTQELAAMLSDATRTTDGPAEAAATAPATPEAATPAGGVEAARSPIRAGLRKTTRLVAWPVRRIFDPRFGGLARQIDAKQIDLFDRLDHLRDEALSMNHERAQSQSDLADLAKYQAEQLAIAVGLLEAQLEASAEATAILGRTLVDVRNDTQEAAGTLQSIEGALHAGMENTGTPTETDLVGAGEVERLSTEAARLLNFSNSHVGFAAQRRLWINHPVGLEYRTGEVRVGSVNERIVEVPYAMRAMSGIAPPAAILDVGAAESTLSLSLASLGYRVTAVDPNGYPFQHPNLEILESPITALPNGRRFAAALCISTIEHIGLGGYGQAPSDENDDLAAIERVHRALAPEGLLVLTVPFGTPREDERERTYNHSTLDRLLDGWNVLDCTIVHGGSGQIWAPMPENRARADAVALVTARPR